MSDFQYMHYEPTPQYHYPPQYYQHPPPHPQFYYPQAPPTGPPPPAQQAAYPGPVYHPPRRASHPVNQTVWPSPPPPPPAPAPASTSTADSPVNENHCAFVFGWDFTAPDISESGRRSSSYTPSPRSTKSDMRYKSQPSPAERMQDPRERPSRPTVNTGMPAAAYPGVPRTPLTDTAYQVIMQTMEGTLQPGQPEPLSGLHRRLFPANCHLPLDGSR